MKTSQKTPEAKIKEKVENALGKEFPLRSEVMNLLTKRLLSARAKAADDAQKLFLSSLGKDRILGVLGEVVKPRRKSSAVVPPEPEAEA
jgi:hypothetical protein